VLFTLMAERYERRSMLITSNLVFSEWGQIFNPSLTGTGAAEAPGSNGSKGLLVAGAAKS